MPTTRNQVILDPQFRGKPKEPAFQLNFNTIRQDPSFVPFFGALSLPHNLWRARLTSKMAQCGFSYLGRPIEQDVLLAWRRAEAGGAVRRRKLSQVPKTNFPSVSDTKGSQKCIREVGCQDSILSSLRCSHR